MQAWWLDQVCAGGSWDVCLAFDQGQHITGVLPFWLTRVGGLKMIKAPPLTPYLGIHLQYPANEQKNERRYAFEKKVITELLTHLPKVAYCTFNHPLALANGLPFFWQGFQQSNLYTYRIPSDWTPEEVYAGMKSSVRNKIEKAAFTLTITESNDVHEFYDINQKTFARQHRKVPYSRSFLAALDRALAERGQRKILIARDVAGKAHAALYLVWDQEVVYNLALGGDTELRKSGAVQLLLWQGIQWALEQGRTFDFEGSFLEPVESVFRDFGGLQMPYLRITKFGNKAFKALYALFR